MNRKLPQNQGEKAASSIDAKSLYQEGCASLRHYSTCVLNTRTITIAQGFVLLTAANYLVSQGRFALSLTVSAFGLLFTLILHSLQSSYWHVFNIMLATVVQIERENSAGMEGPWQEYDSERKKGYQSWAWQIFVRRGPFLLLVFSFAVTAGYCILVLR
jgi:hypothetical protein